MKVKLVKATVSIDGLPENTVVNVYMDPTYRWNGWVNALFTLEGAVKYLSGDCGTAWKYDSEKDEFVMRYVDHGPEDAWTSQGIELETEDGVIKLYDLTPGYCWDLCEIKVNNYEN